jgi:hypothetical protein
VYVCMRDLKLLVYASGRLGGKRKISLKKKKPSMGELPNDKLTEQLTIVFSFHFF